MYNTQVLRKSIPICPKEDYVVYTLTQKSKFFSDSGWVTVYGINICEYCGGVAVQSFQIKDFSSKLEKTIDLINILHKNSVRPSETEDLIEDFLEM